MKKNLQKTIDYIKKIDTEAICDKVKMEIITILKVYSGEKMEEEKTYHIGQRFKNDGDVYLLCKMDTTGDMKTGLANLCDGNMWSDPVSVEKFTEITQEEFEKITSGDIDEFTLIEED